MEIRTAFVSHGETPKTMQPRERPLDDPAHGAETAPMWRAAFRQDRRDAAGPEALAVRFGVVAPITLQGTRPPHGSAATASDGRERVDHRIQLGDVIDIRGRHLGDERDPVRVGDDVVFGPRLAAIGWVRSSFFPPHTARTLPLSMIVQRRSRRPRRRNSASRTSCNRCHTPVRCQATKRRQQVLPDPHPISSGSICHGSPPRSTNKMPVNAARSGMRGRPPRSTRRRRRLGSNGAIRAQRALTLIRFGGQVNYAV